MDVEVIEGFGPTFVVITHSDVVANYSDVGNVVKVDGWFL